VQVSLSLFFCFWSYDSYVSYTSHNPNELFLSYSLQIAAEGINPLQSNYAMTLLTTPAPTVLPPSRIANRVPSSRAIGAISSTSILTLSPGITISVPSWS